MAARQIEAAGGRLRIGVDDRMVAQAGFGRIELIAGDAGAGPLASDRTTAAQADQSGIAADGIDGQDQRDDGIG